MAERHSPLPWRVHDRERRCIVRGPEDRDHVDYRDVALCHEFAHSGDGAEQSDEANARYIVNACNLYPELIAALRDVLPLAVDLDDCDHANRYCNCKLRAVIERARAVLAKADHAVGEGTK